jgi:uncharacterized membrane protein YvlD (DUF360 family)
MAFIAKIKSVFQSPKLAIGCLVLGFSGFMIFGLGIFLANYIHNEWLAIIAMFGMALFGAIAITGYLAVWYFRLFKSH